MKKNILVFLDELFYSQDNKVFKSKFVSLNFLKKFEEKYDEFNFYYSFPCYKGDISDYGSIIENKNNIYPIDGWHNIISFYKSLFNNRKNIKQLVNNIYKDIDIVFIRIPSPAGMILGKEFEKQGKKVIYNVVGDIKNAFNNYKFPLNIPAFLLSQYLYKQELSLNGVFLTVGSELTNRFKHKNSIFFIDSLVLQDNLQLVNSEFSNPIKILYVGRLLKSKGIYLLIEAIKEINKKLNIELHIVGFGKEENNINSLSEQLNFIRFYGKISNRDELNNIYKQCDIVVLPTINSEGFPRVILEAWVNGKYVISSKVGGIEGLAKDNENILFFKPGNKKELIEKLETLIQDEILKQTLKKGIQKVQNKITFEYYSDILYKVLKG